MSYQQLQRKCDSSTFANYSEWAKSISDWIISCGWVQANDSGQVVWTATSMTLTQVAVSGGNAVYSYSSYTGPAPRVGMSVAFSGFATGGNNVTATLTAVSGGASGTVTVATTTQANETHAGTGATTAASTVPGSGAYYYEIFTPGDAGTTFYLKIEYGNTSGSNAPDVRLTLSTTTSGTGTATGYVVGPTKCHNTAITAPSSTTQYECDYHGSTSRLAVLMWRNTGSSSAPPLVFAIERSLNSSGTETNTYVTLWTGGRGQWTQQSLYFGVGAAPTFAASANQWAVLGGTALTVTLSFNNAIPFDPARPVVGFADYACTVIGVAPAADISEGVTFTATVYGATRTYIPTKNASFSSSAICVRYD